MQDKESHNGQINLPKKMEVRTPCKKKTTANKIRKIIKERETKCKHPSRLFGILQQRRR